MLFKGVFILGETREGNDKFYVLKAFFHVLMEGLRLENWKKWLSYFIENFSREREA